MSSTTHTSRKHSAPLDPFRNRKMHKLSPSTTAPLHAEDHITKATLRTTLRATKRKRNIEENKRRIAQAAKLEAEDAAFEADDEDKDSHEKLIRVPYCRFSDKYLWEDALKKKEEEEEEREEKPWDKDYPIPTVGEKRMYGVGMGLKSRVEDHRAVIKERKEEKSGNRVVEWMMSGWVVEAKRYEPCERGFFEELVAPAHEADFWEQDGEGRKREEHDKIERWEHEWSQIGVNYTERVVDQEEGVLPVGEELFT